MKNDEKLFDKLNTALDVLPACNNEDNLPAVQQAKDERNAEDDYDYTKEKLKDILEQSEDVLEHAADIAKETGEPRSIEVFAGLAKTMGDLAKSVMDNSKIKSAVDKDRGIIKNPGISNIPTDGSITQNNQTIFVGTTKELHEMLDAEEVIEVTATAAEEV